LIVSSRFTSRVMILPVGVFTKIFFVLISAFIIGAVDYFSISLSFLWLKCFLLDFLLDSYSGLYCFSFSEVLSTSILW
jgi:hypothetical protein